MKRLQKDQIQGILSTSGGVPGTLGMSLNDNVLGRGQQVSGLVGPNNKDNIMRKNNNKKIRTSNFYRAVFKSLS